jgi:sulfate transport system ATP-binding protein
MNCYLQVSGISKSFGKENVLNNINFSIKRGKILSILGPSGCGKSTTLKIIAGLIKQDSGGVILCEKCIDSLPANQRNIGFVFQNYSLFNYMTVRKNIEFGLKIRHKPSQFIEKKIKELLELTNLNGLENKKPSQLSGGQQQRVALARALAIEPKLLLLDEPFAALDTKIRRRLRRDLKRIQNEFQITMIFVTHDQEEAFEVGDNVAIMNNGDIEQIGIPRELYDHPTTRFVAKFVGNMNVFKLPSSNSNENSYEVMVRPEDIVLYKKVRKKRDNEYSGSLTNYVFLGPIIEARIVLENNERLSALLTKAQFIKKGIRRGDKLIVKINRFQTLGSSNS